MSLKTQLLGSMMQMGFQRVLDFFSIFIVTTVIIRSLDRSEYGLLSIVLSYGLLFSVFNISISAVLVRDFPRIKGELSRYMNAFNLFSIMKTAVALLLTVVIGIFLYARYHSGAMILVLLFSSASTVAAFFTEPFITLLSVDFKQGEITRINAVTSIINVVLSCGAILIPSAVYVAGKNAVIAIIAFVLPLLYVRKRYPLAWSFDFRGHWQTIRSVLGSFSLWSHLMGLVTDMVYRADLLFLGWMHTSLRTMGNYNIALQMGNFSRLLPQILQYHTSLALSNRSTEKQRQEELTFLFVK
jgi:O-antigen/teichoic acid export membrane protein